MKSHIWLVTVLVVATLLTPVAEAEDGRVPIIYSNDIFHPLADYGDHYMIACLFAIKELDVKAVILDIGEQQKTSPGRIVMEQIFKMSGRTAPYAIGLSRPLRSRTDKGLDQPKEFQEGVELILSVLRNSKEKVIYYGGGGFRDIVAAYNREPELVKAKLRGIYISADWMQANAKARNECNVDYSPYAVFRLSEIDVPFYWAPCAAPNGYCDSFPIDSDAAVLKPCTEQFQNFMIYGLARGSIKDDPIKFLDSGPHPLPPGHWLMWDLAEIFHIAGRKIYQRGENDYVALEPPVAKTMGLADKKVESYEYVPARITLSEAYTCISTNTSHPTGFVFHQTNTGLFEKCMLSSFKNLLVDFGR